MTFLADIVLYPFVITLVSVMGGSLGLGIALYYYYLRRKSKYRELEQQLSRELVDQEAGLEELRQQREKLKAVAPGDEFDIIDNDELDEAQKKILLEEFARIDEHVAQAERDLERLQRRYQYAKNYTYWQVVEDLINRRYFDNRRMFED